MLPRIPAMLYVDGVSSIASIDFRMDDWGVDLAVTGSQKGLMLPAGLGIVCASAKALTANKNARCVRGLWSAALLCATMLAWPAPASPQGSGVADQARRAVSRRGTILSRVLGQAQGI
jgi:aspartate aminotransferase-like enzyme